MKFTALVAALLFVSLASYSQTEVNVSDAGKHIGETVKICDKVYGVKSLEKLSLVNLGARYPKSPLTIVFYEESRKQLKGTPENLFDNKKICITGKIELYKGKPQIVVWKPDQILVQE
ncbi:MAG: hypothetical protein ACO1OO_09575 [Flavisolibacter sp.]